jgi:hypothetical protein
LQPSTQLITNPHNASHYNSKPNVKKATYLHAYQAGQQADDCALHHHPRAMPHASHAITDQLDDVQASCLPNATNACYTANNRLQPSTRLTRNTHNITHNIGNPTATYLHANQARQQADDRALHHHSRAMPYTSHAKEYHLE